MSQDGESMLTSPPAQFCTSGETRLRYFSGLNSPLSPDFCSAGSPVGPKKHYRKGFRLWRAGCKMRPQARFDQKSLSLKLVLSFIHSSIEGKFM